jgi:hypothetical protein
MPDTNIELADKIANSWTGALQQECHDCFGEDREVIFLSTICGAFA